MPAEWPPLSQIWVYLSGSPLFSLVLTLGVYSLCLLVYERAGRHPISNPVLWTMTLVSIVLVVMDMPYAQYFQGGQFIHFLLGTATVALAIPIYSAWHSLRGRVGVLLLSLLAGGATSIVTAAGTLYLMGADSALIKAMWAKSVTTPIAMGVAERIDASPTLAAVFAVTTGIIGAVLGRYVLNTLKVTAWWQRGFAVGVAAHGVGTSHALNVHPYAGAYASMGMGLHGIVGAVLIPVAVALWPWY